MNKQKQVEDNKQNIWNRCETFYLAIHPVNFYFFTCRSKSSQDDAPYYSTNFPASPGPQSNNRSIMNLSTVPGASNSEEYEVPRDNTGYQDLDLSTMTSSEDQYQGLYAQVS